MVLRLGGVSVCPLPWNRPAVARREDGVKLGLGLTLAAHVLALADPPVLRPVGKRAERRALAGCACSRLTSTRKRDQMCLGCHTQASMIDSSYTTGLVPLLPLSVASVDSSATYGLSLRRSPGVARCH
jgi:hypothetical protein